MRGGRGGGVVDACGFRDRGLPSWYACIQLRSVEGAWCGGGGGSWVQWQGGSQCGGQGGGVVDACGFRDPALPCGAVAFVA